MSDNLPHFWTQGPKDLVLLYAPITYWERHWEWQFCWFLETPDAFPNLSPDQLREKVDYILNKHGWGWHRAGVHFTEVTDIAKAQIVLRFTDAPPVGWPDLPWGPGWYYHDGVINKNVAQMTANPFYITDPFYSVYIIGMEMAGHGCFRMHDMYLHGHGLYVGAMGDMGAALPTYGYPTTEEIEAAKQWLRGEAPQVHAHVGVATPNAPHIHAHDEAVTPEAPHP